MTRTPLRDRIVWRVCNFMINHVASDFYRRSLTAIIYSGVADLVDMFENRKHT